MALSPIQVPIPSNWTLDFIERYMAQAAPVGALPIPSQKNGICASDSLGVVFFLSDELRPFFWSVFILGHPYLSIQCQHEVAGTDTSQSDKILMCWLAISAARIAGMVRTHMVAYSLVQRLPSEPLGQITPIGDTCGGLARIYNGVGAVDRNGQYALAPEYIGAVFSGVAARVSQTLGMTVKMHGELTPSDNIVAINLLMESEEGPSHAVSMTKILGQWYWCDNNLGFAIPIGRILGATGTSPRDVYFALGYGYDMWVGHSPEAGGPIYSSTKLTFPGHGGSGPTEVYAERSGHVYRRYICAPIGAGVNSLRSRQLAEMRAGLATLLQTSPVGPTAGPVQYVQPSHTDFYGSYSPSGSESSSRSSSGSSFQSAPSGSAFQSAWSGSYIPSIPNSPQPPSLAPRVNSGVFGPSPSSRQGGKHRRRKGTARPPKRKAPSSRRRTRRRKTTYRRSS